MINASIALARFQDNARTDDISDNNWLDQFRLPVGSWFEQTVDWIDDNLGWLLSIIKWPFEVLFDIIMNPNPSKDSLMSISWLWIVLGFFVIGSMLRNTRIGFMAAVMVFLCGILGREEYDNGVLDGGFWFQTSKTFGMILVAVLLCAIVGLPLGILCGRSNGVWNVTRPVLDAMQVIHPFVWMLPFVAFWGIGEVSATMVTMMFALPPLVRLTNLGIRQVPEDVVEASRSFGANELRVLTDVQMPLARPAIMTGLNQTLLLAISMLGVAAIMGADGLGKLIFRAINNKDVALAVSAGLAFFFVAVVLDRTTQPEEDDGLSLFGRLGKALDARRNPEALLAAADPRADAEAQAAVEPAERLVPVSSAERTGLLVIIGGAAVAILGVLLPWASDGSVLSSWGRLTDLSLEGQTFSGVNGAGGSWFGVVLIALAITAILAASRPLIATPHRSIAQLDTLQLGLLAIVGAYLPVAFVLNLLDVHSEALEMIALWSLVVAAIAIGIQSWLRGTPRLGADGAAIAAIGAIGLPFAYLFAQGPAGASPASTGIGVWIALLGTIVAAVGAVLALRAAPYASERPVSHSFSPGALVATAIAVALGFAGATAAWFVDERQGFRNREYFRGLTDDGPGLGTPLLILLAVAALISIALAGVIALSDTNRWRIGTAAAGIGVALMAVPFAWSMVIAVTGDADFFNDLRSLSGAAVLFAMLSGFVFFAQGRSAIKHFRRRKIYADATGTAPVATTRDASSDEGDSELVTLGSGGAA